MPSLSILLARYRDTHTDASLAQAIGVSITAVRGVNEGRVPNTRTREKFARFLGLSAEEMDALSEDSRRVSSPTKRPGAHHRHTYEALIRSGREALTALHHRCAELEAVANDPLVERLHDAGPELRARLLAFLEAMER